MRLSYLFLFSDPVNNLHRPIAAIKVDIIKEDHTYDDAVASTSWKQHLVIKREESIDIKRELLPTVDDNLGMDLVSFHTYLIF
jgi:hypothetical protein